MIDIDRSFWLPNSTMFTDQSHILTYYHGCTLLGVYDIGAPKIQCIFLTQIYL